MSTSSPLSHLGKAFEAAELEERARAFEMDGEYVRRGFLTVGAIIEREKEIFGSDSCELFIARQLESEGYLKVRDERTRWAEVLRSAKESEEPDAFSRAVEQLRTDSQVGSWSKRVLLSRYAPQVFSAMFEPYSPRINAAALQERGMLCSYCSEAANQRLFNREDIPRRKEIWNAVAEQAYGQLGFEMHSRRKGVCSFWKRLGERYAMRIEVDVVHLETVSQDFGQDYGDICGLGPTLIVSSQLVSANKQDRTILTEFSGSYRSYASIVYAQYGDARSMEVSVRAAAVRYELGVVPFERAILQAVQAD